MPRLMAAIYDRFMRPTERACLSGWRDELLRDAGGDVLEIGSGTGANLGRYGAGVDSIVLCEPDPHMRVQLEHNVRAMPPERAEATAAVTDAAVEELPFEADRFDTVVSTLVLCSVDSQARALAEIRRVLKPGGRLLFIEHVVAHDRPGRQVWQHRLEPAWRVVAGNCHLTRDTAAAIERAGFELVELTRESMRKALPIVRPSIRGAARKA